MLPIDPGKPFFQCIKTSLKSVVRDPIVIEKLTNAAALTNRIMTHTLQIIKLYFIYLYDHGAPLPTLDKPFVTSVMKVLCDASPSGRPKAEMLRVKDELTRFYAEHYEPVMLDALNYRHLYTALDYMAIDVITMYENNIKQHYCQYVERFVNVSLRKRERIEVIKATEVSTGQKKAQTNLLCRELRKVKDDILGVNDPKTSDPQYHKWIDEQRPRNGKRTGIARDGNLKKMQSDVWGLFFKTDMKCFHRVENAHSYTFHHMIETDGVSCSIALIRKDKAGKIVKTPKAKKSGGEKYIDELSEEERGSLAEKKLVGIDPNMGDLLYCVNSDQRDQTKFRYLQNTCRKGTKYKKYRNMLQSMKRDVVDSRRIAEWGADMSTYNKKTLNFEAFKVYLQ
ncbi:hypothetical protein BBJ28_00007147 [Nothophytophthora sp. Chile5]|nr:hypothetical protein BBJ28_00007147 [Nothophytophthora sp. Chile5]